MLETDIFYRLHFPAMWLHFALCQLDLHDLRALLGFECWQSANKGLPLGSVKAYLGSIDGVDASIIEVVLDCISPSSFGAAFRSLPAMDVWVEVIDSSYREGGWHAVEMSKPA